LCSFETESISKEETGSVKGKYITTGEKQVLLFKRLSEETCEKL
jgi:hypothetical protein